MRGRRFKLHHNLQGLPAIASRRPSVPASIARALCGRALHPSARQSGSLRAVVSSSAGSRFAGNGPRRSAPVIARSPIGRAMGASIRHVADSMDTRSTASGVRAGVAQASGAPDRRGERVGIKASQLSGCGRYRPMHEPVRGWPTSWPFDPKRPWEVLPALSESPYWYGSARQRGSSAFLMMRLVGANGPVDHGPIGQRSDSDT